MKQKWKRHSWALKQDAHLRGPQMEKIQTNKKPPQGIVSRVWSIVGLTAPARITEIAILFTTWGPRASHLRSGPCKNTCEGTHPRAHLHWKGNWQKEQFGLLQETTA